MKITDFFIKHPVTSIILNSMIMVIGLLCLNTINLREYPNINLPTLIVQTNYPNASAELIEYAITNPLEDQLAAMEGLEYITSQSKDNSSYINLNFIEGTSIDKALSATREAVALAKIYLPKEVSDPIIQRQSKQNGIPFLWIALTAPNSSLSEVTHYANLYLKNAFRSLPGVASAEVWGAPFTMTISLDMKKMLAFGVNVDEVYQALERRNISLPVGKFKNTIPTTLDLHLSKINDFEDVLIKDNNKNPIFLKSIADIKLKSDDRHFRIHVDGQQAVGLSITPASDANPLEVAKVVRDQINNLKINSSMPLNMELILDQSEFITASLHNIKSSIIEAILLVLVIVLLFLRDAKATIIPIITIPISLLGSLILLKIFGFSLNTITLLAMVLAIGLVVDDSIVVLENIKRYIEQGLTPLNAALIGSKEIGFAIVAMTFTLSAVYMPIAFIEGTMGKLFIEFAVALAGSVIISGIVALTLSPLMCSKFLSPTNLLNIENENKLLSKIEILWKNLEVYYEKNLNKIFKYKKHTIITALLLCLLSACLFKLLPHEITPKEDRGIMGAFTPAVSGVNIDTLEKHATNIENLLQAQDIKEAIHYLSFVGDWGASVVLPFKEHRLRKRSPQTVVNILQNKLNSFPSIDVYGWSIDSGLPGIDSNQGSDLQLAISTIGDYRSLLNAVTTLQKTVENKNLFGLIFHDLDLDAPGYKINLDQNTMAHLNISPLQVAKTIEVFFSGQHSLLFEKDNIKYPITLQGNSNPWTLNELYITNQKNNHISLGTLANITPSTMPATLNHYNQMRTATLVAKLNKNQNINAAMQDLSIIANDTLPKNVTTKWIGAAKIYQKSSYTMLLLFSMAIIFIYAILAIQFENFLDPIIIMLTIPLASFGAIFTGWIFGQSINIYTQIGLITLIGLITKHGILIVEFANQQYINGINQISELSSLQLLQTAIKNASLIRLRPILMTTSAMILGALPLVISEGAGFEARRAIGIILIGGLLFGTFFTLFILPQFYYLIKKHYI